MQPFCCWHDATAPCNECQPACYRTMQQTVLPPHPRSPSWRPRPTWHFRFHESSVSRCDGRAPYRRTMSPLRVWHDATDLPPHSPTEVPAPRAPVIHLKSSALRCDGRTSSAWGATTATTTRSAAEMPDRLWLKGWRGWKWEANLAGMVPLHIWCETWYVPNFLTLLFSMTVVIWMMESKRICLDSHIRNDIKL